MNKYNPNDPKSVKDRQESAAFEVQSDLLALKEILSLKAGRRLIWRYLSFCRLFESSFNASGSVTFYNEGMRNVGLKILSDITASDPSAFVEMMKENQRESV